MKNAKECAIPKNVLKIPMKAVVLIRVSDKEQEDNHSLDAQEARLLAYCSQHSLESPKIFRVVESSTRGDRKQFQEVVQYIKAQGEKSALVVEAIDRLQRSFKESVLFDEMRQREEVELHFVKENLVINEKADPTKLLMWDFGVVTAKAYVANLSHNIRRSNEKKLKNGEYTRQAPVGYLNYRDEFDKSQIRVDETRAYLVKKAFEMYATGNYSLSAITKYLKEKGLTNNTKLANPLSKSGVHKMLQDKFYIGIMTINSKEYPHKYPKLIDEWTFRKCQEVREGYHRKPFKYNAKEFIFKGILKNKATGRLMSGDIKKNKYIYYYSPKYEDSPASKVVKEEVILEQVEAIFKKIVIPPEILGDLRERLKNTHEAKVGFKNNMVDEIRKKSDGFDRKLSNLLDLRIADSITQDEYDKKAYKLKQDKEDLKIQLKQLDDADEKFSITVQYLLSLSSRAYEIFQSSKVEQKRQLINFVLSNLSLEGEKLHYELNKPFDAIVKCSERSDWYRLVDSIGTAIKEHQGYIHFPDFCKPSYV